MTHTIGVSRHGQPCRLAGTLLAALFALSRPVVAAEPPRYDLEAIEAAGATTFATGINRAGQVAGWLEREDGTSRAFRWSQGQGIQDLGSLGGTSSSAEAINERGWVVGWATTATGHSRAFLWTPESGMRDLGTPAGAQSTAWAIDAAGRVVGEMTRGEEPPRAFLWTPEEGMRELGTLGGEESTAYGVGDGPRVVGSATLASGDKRAFLWTPGAGLRDLGTLGGTYSTAGDIGPAGQVVGGAERPDGNRHAFLWTPESGMQDLGVLSGSLWSHATSINAHGLIAGWSNVGSRVYHTRAVLYTRDTGMVDLNTRVEGGAAWELTMATAINELGDLVVWGRPAGSRLDGRPTRAFRLVPRVGRLASSEATLDFGRVLVGTRPVRQITLRSIGRVGWDGQVDAPSEPFSLAAGGGAFALPSGQTRSLAVQFAPTRAGGADLFRGTLIGRSADPFVAPLAVTLTAEAVHGGRLAISPDPARGLLFELDRVALDLGGTRGETIRLTNSGAEPLGGHVVATGPFAVTAGGGDFLIPPGESRTVTLQFPAVAPAPADGGTGNLTITSSDPAAGSVTVPLKAVVR